MTQSKKVFSLTGDFKKNPENQEYLMTPPKNPSEIEKIKKAKKHKTWEYGIILKIRRKTIGKRTFADHLLHTNHWAQTPDTDTFNLLAALQEAVLFPFH